MSLSEHAQEFEDVFKQVDKLFIGDEIDIDKYQQDEFHDKVLPATSFKEELIESLFGENKIEGLYMPWGVMADKFRLRQGELTIWTGLTGEGKSLMIGQVMLNILKQKSNVCIASLELHPIETLKRMAGQFHGIEVEDISEQGIVEFIDKVSQHLRLYSETGDMTPDRVKALCRYSRAELDTNHIVIDSLMKCGTREGKHDQEKELCNSLQNIAKQTGLHIHLVAHMRKPSEGRRPSKYDISGTAHLVNMADNILIVSRNEKKEFESVKQDPKQEILDQPDAFLTCDKQRHGKWEKKSVGLWFHESGQYSTRDKRMEMSW